MGKMTDDYEILSPWADADPVPLKGITPRTGGLADKRIGFLYNISPPSRMILTVVEARLKERFPGCTTVWYANELPPGKGIADLEGEEKAKFEEWVKKVDVVAAAVGD